MGILQRLYVVYTTTIRRLYNPTHSDIFASSDCSSPDISICHIICPIYGQCLHYRQPVRYESPLERNISKHSASSVRAVSNIRPDILLRFINFGRFYFFPKIAKKDVSNRPIRSNEFFSIKMTSLVHGDSVSASYSRTVRNEGDMILIGHLYPISRP